MRKLARSEHRGLGNQWRVEEIVPSPSRTVSSLRDIGYDTTHAIADLIDNSLTAGSSNIDVTLHFDGAKSWIRVVDDGAGMDAATLHEAMRYGSERDYAEEDLGKFGFGLKTASTSQCRRTTVASRRSTQYARLEVRSLDLDHIVETNRWEVIVLDGEERPRAVTEPLARHTGTVVLWENLDRVLAFKDPWGEWANKYLLGLAEEIDQHLGMVFHRFISGAVPDQPSCTITVNGAEVVPWDPFCLETERTQKLPPKNLALGAGIVRVCPYVLPRQSEFSSEVAWKRASGPASWNRQQGFYVYRGHRLIQSGGWNRMRTTDEHTKLARVSVDFAPVLDSLFGINITKAYVKFPRELRDQLEDLVAQVTRVADNRYRGTTVRGQGDTGSSAARQPVPKPDPPRPLLESPVGPISNRAMAGTERASEPTSAPVPARARPSPREALEAAATAVGEDGAFGKIVDALRAGWPEVARELGW